MRETDIPVESLQRPDGNSLQDNYKHHDAAEDVFRSLLPEWVTPLQLGIDRRDDESGLIFDNKLDFLLDGPGGQVMVDLKSKQRSDWVRLLNERHYKKYLEAAEKHDCPAYIFFYCTSTENIQLCRVDNGGRVYTTTDHRFMLTFPDGNKAAYMCSGCDVGWTQMLQKLK